MKLSRYSRMGAVRLLTGFVPVLILVAACPAAAQPLQPGPALEPAEVVSIQLEALQRNNEPRANAGIEQVWAFAHPRNRAITGPLSRFMRMLRGPGYGVLINHRRHEIQEVTLNEREARYTVTVIANDGGFFKFDWRLELADLAVGAAWMTTQVMPGQRTGEQLSSLRPSTTRLTPAILASRKKL